MALPVIVVPEQCVSLNDAIVYVVVTVGETSTVIVGAVPLKGVPSDKVPEMVPAPVTERTKVVVEPLQIVVDPESTAVGSGLTVIVPVALTTPQPPVNGIE